jgi:hypothetical protein
MSEEDWVELSQPHTSKDHPYYHVDAFVRDRITGKVIDSTRRDGFPVDP